MSPPTLYSARDVADRFGLSVQWLLKLTYEKGWPHRRLGRTVKYSDKDIAAIMELMEGEPPARKGRPRRAS